MSNFTWFGQWVSGTSYSVNTFVKKDNICYVSTNSFYSLLPPNEDMLNWNVFVIGVNQITPTPSITPTQTPSSSSTPLGPVLFLDAGNNSSYGGTGSTWYDISGFGNNGNINGPTYNSLQSGYFDFNGTSDLIDFTTVTQIPINNENYTISVWVSPDNLLSDDGIIGWGNYGNVGQANAIRFLNNGGNQAIINYWWYYDLAVNQSYSTNTWYNIIASFDGTTRKLYFNGTNIGSDSPTGHNVGINSNLTVGRTYINEYFNGKISIVKVWKRALSNIEVGNEWDDYKGRYGYNITPTPTITNTPTVTPSITLSPTPTITNTPTITPTSTITNTPTVTPTPTITPTPNIVTNGLVIQLDAYTSSSYPGTGTTVYDIKSGYNHTLTNAPYTVLSGVKCFDCNGLTTNIRVNSTGPTLPSSGYTYVSWVRIKNNSTTYRTLYRTAPNDHPVLVNISTNTLGFYDNDTPSFFSTGYDVTPILDTWAQLTVVGTSTGSTFYINTTQVGSVSYNAAGNRHDYWGSINGQPFGYVANMYYYNKSLSLSEITQQYNFLSTRFV